MPDGKGSFASKRSPTIQPIKAMEAILNELALVRSKIEAMYAVRAQSPDLPELPIFYGSLLRRETDLLRRVNEPAAAQR